MTFPSRRSWIAGTGPRSVGCPMFDGRREFGIDPGVRLLVSGQPRWGGAPLDDPIAWPGGFTRLWDKGTADEWAATLA